MNIDWTKSEGLIPAIIQHAQTHEVLMLGYMSKESLKLTQETGLVTFYSRSRRSIWVKGETSGNTFQVVDISPDCDRDTLLIQALPNGPACHRKTTTCFDPSFEFLTELEEIINNRINTKIQKSYIASLVSEGIDRVAQKVGEEAIETVIAAKNENPEHFESEAADLLFHFMVLLQFKNSSLSKVVQHLQQRHQVTKKKP